VRARRSASSRSPGAPACRARWLYTEPALRAEIERLRDRASGPSDGVPARQRASEASLRQCLEILRAENQRLREENSVLKAELAIAYGQQRQARGA
jgi:hypothetical protein